MNKIIIFCFIMILFSACVKDVDIPLPATVSKIVLNAELVANKAIVVEASQSYSLRDRKYPEPISGATIILKENEILVDTLAYDANTQNYKSRIIAKEGNTYQLLGAVPKLQSVDATATIPSAPVCRLVSFMDSVKVEDNTVTCKLNFELSDNINQKNYYILSFQSVDTSQDKQSYIVFAANHPHLNNQQAPNVAGEENYVNQLIFTDEAFNGQSNTYEIKIKDFGTFSQGPFPMPISGPFNLVLKSISKAYYDYLISLDIYNQNQGNPFAEPVQVTSNVNNGFGIMAGSAIKTIRLR